MSDAFISRFQRHLYFQRRYHISLIAWFNLQRPIMFRADTEMVICIGIHELIFLLPLCCIGHGYIQITLFHQKHHHLSLCQKHISKLTIIRLKCDYHHIVHIFAAYTKCFEYSVNFCQGHCYYINVATVLLPGEQNPIRHIEPELKGQFFSFDFLVAVSWTHINAFYSNVITQRCNWRRCFMV